LMKFFYHQKYKIIISTEEVKKFDLKRKDETWVSGYIEEICNPSTEFPKGTTQFTKGRIACICDHIGKVGEKRFLFRNPKKTISSIMTQIECDKKLWGARMKLATMIKGAEYTLLVPLHQLLKSETQLRRELHVSLPWKDTMVFTLSEINYFDTAFSKPIQDRIEFENNFTGQDESQIWKDHIATKAALKYAIQKATGIRNMRAIVLFPQGDKKSIQVYRRKSLSDKISNMKFITYAKLFNPGLYIDELTGTIKAPTTTEYVIVEKQLQSMVNVLDSYKPASIEYQCLHEYYATLKEKFSVIEEDFFSQDADEERYRNAYRNRKPPGKPRDRKDSSVKEKPDE
jgi:hypothetical protein